MEGEEAPIWKSPMRKEYMKRKEKGLKIKCLKLKNKEEKITSKVTEMEEVEEVCKTGNKRMNP